VFSRREPFGPAPIDSSQTLFLGKQFWFFEKTRKKLTSGTLYSVFKEPRPRSSRPRSRAGPPARTERTSASRRTFQLSETWWAPSTAKAPAASERRDGSRRRRPLERSSPCGEREYRAASSPCQANSEKREFVNGDRPFLDFRLHKKQGIRYLAGSVSSTFAIASG